MQIVFCCCKRNWPLVTKNAGFELLKVGESMQNHDLYSSKKQTGKFFNQVISLQKFGVLTHHSKVNFYQNTVDF